MLCRQPLWARSLKKSWKQADVPPLEKQGILLRKGIRLLNKVSNELPSIPFALLGHPFDRHLLDCNSLYRQSRKLYLDKGGRFESALVSSPRTLSSPTLLDLVIEYSPVEGELVWSATDPLESKHPERLLALRTYITNLFHEQNHRILWHLLPSAPASPGGLRRYLNFAESLVIIADMALGDQMGRELSVLFYLVGVTYDPGTTVYEELRSRREYRNYLQAALHATYLHLELYSPSEIPQAISALYPMLGSFAERAAIRSGHLDEAFIHKTNVQWQKKHRKLLIEKLCVGDRGTLELPEDPMDNREQYLLGEKWFDLLGL